MRADTHDGPEQMLHVRGLIHCCSSHVRRSWNSVLQRTAGPYIMALFGLGSMSDLSPQYTRKRTLTNRCRTALGRGCLWIFAENSRPQDAPESSRPGPLPSPVPTPLAAAISNLRGTGCGSG